MRSTQNKCWALSEDFGHSGRLLLGRYCWATMHRPVALSATRIALFETRRQARKAQETCCYKKTRVEKVCVTVEVIE